MEAAFHERLAEAESARRKGAIDDAIAIAGEALASAEQSSQAEWVALAQLDLGNLHRYVPNALESFRLLQAAEAYLRATGHPLLAKALARQGMTLGDMGDHTGALDLYREALAGIEAHMDANAGDGDTTDTSNNVLAATCFGAIGVACTQLDDFPQAETAYQRAIKLYADAGNHESICFVLNNLAILRIRALERLDAGTAATAAANIAARAANDAFQFIDDGMKRNREHVNSIMVRAALHNSRGNLLSALNRLEESLVEIDHSLAAYREMHLPRGIADALSNLGETHARLGNLDLAITHFNEAGEIVGTHQLKDHERKLQQLFADIFERRGEHAKALLHFKRFHQLETENQRNDTQKKLQQLAVRAEIDKALTEARQQRERSVDLAASNVALDRIAHEDALTGVANRRRLDAWAGDQPIALPTGLAVALLDIDHFKMINDDFSHATGDAVLRELGKLLRTQARAEDLIARYGGEEFVIVLHGVTAAQLAVRMERLRALVELHDWSRTGEGLAVTTSIGVAAADGRSGFKVLLEQADVALYAAKKAGRNRVVVADA